ncbi:MAG: hypothetical protein ACI9KE_003903 [Polyangiales bacterium]|jgi:hypothetical protein
MSETLEPLLIRKGSRYRCFGDGLCCTDIHALGPLSDGEVARLALVRDEVVHYNHLVDANVLTTLADGHCIFRTEEGCGLHVPMDGALKPVGCWRYPLGLTATPMGGRVILEHRCPCTLLGDRPLLTEENVREALISGGEEAKLTANHRVAEVPLTESDSVTFEEYLPIEKVLIDGLASGDLLEALDATPFPTLVERSWDSLADEMLQLPIGGRFEAALQWFGEGIVSRGEKLAKVHPRPWTDAFDRAEARTPEPAEEMEVFRTFAIDLIWSLFWTEHGSMLRTRQELATRLSVGLGIAKTLREEGVRADRASAEAVMILDLVGTSDWWTSAIAEMA